MNSKNRAELQRKLSMNVIPRPPAGLAERIKADIPNHFQAAPAPQRPGRVTTISMRLAASFLLVVTTAVVTVHLMTPVPAEHLAVTSTAAPRNVAPSAKMAQAAAEEARANATAEQPPALIAEVGTEGPILSQPSTAGTLGSATPSTLARLESELVAADAAEPSVDGVNVTDSAPGAVFDAFEEVTEARPRSVAQREATGVAAGAPAAAPPPPPASAEKITVTSEAPAIVAPQRASRGASLSIVPEARAADLGIERKENLFGVSVDAGAFHRIKETLESGHRPPASAVDVDAIVNYFAGTPARAPKKGLRFEVEASPAPVEMEGEHAILRFTVDTAKMTLAPRASAPPIATNVRITVDINDEVVAKYARVGDSQDISTESMLPANVSVTSLYTLELKKGRLRSSTRVATVTLHYTSVTDGRMRTSQKVIHGHDLAASWTRASSRHRLASLGALWGESLKGAATRVDMARAAGALAKEDARNPRARELADAVSATPAER